MDDDEVIWYTTPDLDHLFSKSEESRLLRRLQKCSAVVCYNDQVAIRLIQVMLRNGIRVPEDKSIIGFDNSSISELSPVRITSITHPAELLGQEAAKRLLDMIDSGNRAKSLIMDVELIVKDSTKAREPDDA
jgi:GntR family transcriptional regulator of arabinose operon